MAVGANTADRNPLKGASSLRHLTICPHGHDRHSELTETLTTSAHSHATAQNAFNNALLLFSSQSRVSKLRDYSSFTLPAFIARYGTVLGTGS